MKRLFYCWLIVALGLTGAGRLLAETRQLNGGVRAFERHEFKEAADVFKSILATNATDAEAKLYLGRIALEEERFDDGVRWLEQAAVADPTNAVIFLWLGRGYGLRARTAGPPGGAGPARRAKAAFEKAIALDPNSIEAREGLVMFYREAPRVIGGGRKLALAEAERIKNRDSYWGLLIYGDVLMDARRYAEAEAAYQQAATEKPSNVEAWYRLGILFLEIRQYAKAFAAFDKIAGLKPDEQKVNFYLGKAGALSGERLTEAEKALKRYLQTKPYYIMPQLWTAHFYLGKIYEQQQKFDQARVEYETAVQLRPDYAEARAALQRLRR